MNSRMSETQLRAYLGKDYRPPNKQQRKKAVPRAKGQPKTPKLPPAGEAVLATHLKAHNIAFETEFKFCPHRKWRADFLITGTKILVEVEGGIYTGGRHTRGAGYEKDCEKYNWATAHGWQVHRFSTQKVQKGEAINAILELLSEGVSHD